MYEPIPVYLKVVLIVLFSGISIGMAICIARTIVCGGSKERKENGRK